MKKIMLLAVIIVLGACSNNNDKIKSKNLIVVENNSAPVYTQVRTQTLITNEFIEVERPINSTGEIDTEKTKDSPITREEVEVVNDYDNTLVVEEDVNTMVAKDLQNKIKDDEKTSKEVLDVAEVTEKPLKEKKPVLPWILGGLVVLGGAGFIMSKKK